MPRFLKARHIFDGGKMLEGHTVGIEGREITAVLPAAELPSSAEVIDLGDGFLAPGFIDVQVNGGGGVNLNDTPTARGVLTIASAHRRFGTTGLLPTVITDAPEVLLAATDAVRGARAADPAVLGIHIEGPFLDPVRKGAHEAQFIRPMSPEDVTWLSDLHCGSVLLTLAPNKVSAADVATLATEGLHICLGHAEASHAEAMAALQAGAKGFTHLFNAMSQMTGREPGMVGTALGSDAFAGLIADGFHVHEAMLKLAIKAKPGKIMLVTDAMCTAAGGPDHFYLQGREVRVKDGRLELPDGTLAGSNLTMDEAVRFCVGRLGLPLEQVLPLASANPAAFLGLGHRLGHIRPGHLASLVYLNQDLHVQQTWVEGA
ncbi:MAG: N-acetylglucosamine-6-phosphate deacetylase [Alphaproteobacteria bacterium]|nr:N-acetylglucosamine-6-phosphate deacetylase [Alphaproteobacteria bacterium]